MKNWYVIHTHSNQEFRAKLNLQSQNDEIKDLKIDNNNFYYKKVIKPSSQEIELHKKFLKKSLKKNFFN